MAIHFLFLFFLHMSIYAAQAPAAVRSGQQSAASNDAPDELKPAVKPVAQAAQLSHHVRGSSMPTDFNRGRSSLGDISPPAAAKSTGAPLVASFGVSPRSLSRNRAQSKSKPPLLVPMTSQRNSARDDGPTLQTAEVIAAGLPGGAFRFNVAPIRRKSGSCKSDATYHTEDHSPTKDGNANDQDRDGSKRRTEDNAASQEKAHREKIRQVLNDHSAIKLENLLLLKAGTKVSLQNYLIKCLEGTVQPLCAKYSIPWDEVIKGHITALVESRLDKIQFDDAVKSPGSKVKNLNSSAAGPVGPVADNKTEAIRQSWHQTGSPPAVSRQPTSTTLKSGSATAGGAPPAPKKSVWFCCCTCICD